MVNVEVLLAQCTKEAYAVDQHIIDTRSRRSADVSEFMVIYCLFAYEHKLYR